MTPLHFAHRNDCSYSKRADAFVCAFKNTVQSAFGLVLSWFGVVRVFDTRCQKRIFMSAFQPRRKFCRGYVFGLTSRLFFGACAVGLSGGCLVFGMACASSETSHAPIASTPPQAQVPAKVPAKSSMPLPPQSAASFKPTQPTPEASSTTPAAKVEGLHFQPLQDFDKPWDTDGRKTLLTFVQLTDTHVGRENDHSAFDRMINAVQKLSPKPDFVIITGDLTDTFKAREIKRFRALLARFTVPAYLVPGNHDVGFKPDQKRISNWNKSFPKFRTPYRVDRGPLTLIGVDSQLWNVRRPSNDLDSEAQRQWNAMETMLAKAHRQKRRILMFHHIPAFPVYSISRKRKQRVKAAWKTHRMQAYQKLLARYEVEADLTGHIHRDELYMAGDTFLLNAPPVSEKFGRAPSFRWFRVTEEGLAFRQIYPDAQHHNLSYELDLHGIDEAAFRRWAQNLKEKEWGNLWKQRYAGDEDSSATWQSVDPKFFRNYTSQPFTHQPKTTPGTK